MTRLAVAVLADQHRAHLHHHVASPGAIRVAVRRPALREGVGEGVAQEPGGAAPRVLSRAVPVQFRPLERSCPRMGLLSKPAAQRASSPASLW
eukprot:3776689-Rhodomonas_salina.1